MDHVKPIIAISGCLLGEAIRYDGRDKRHSVLDEKFKSCFTILSFCPEVEMGLGIPRNPIQLMLKDEKIHLVDVSDSSIDHTLLADRTFEKMKDQLRDISGVILTTRSPSCSLKPIDIIGTKDMSMGLWARFLCDHFPSLPKIDSSDLDREDMLNRFIKNVVIYSKENIRS